MIRHDFELFADFFQFYMQDNDIDVGDLSDAWTPEAVARMLAVAPRVVGVGTVRNMDVPVTVEVHMVEPRADHDLWDHVVECSLEAKTGRVVVAGCTDYFPEAFRIGITPGCYRVRASFGGLDLLSANGLDGDDRYRLQLWPNDVPCSVAVIKHRQV